MENVDKAWLLPQEEWSSGFPHGEKDAQKRGDFTYIVYGMVHSSHEAML